MHWLQGNFTFLTYKAVYSLQDIKSYLLFRALDPLMLYLFFATFGAAILGPEYIQFIIVGNVIFICGRTFLLSLIGMFLSERRLGTLGLNICSPTSTFNLIIRRLMIPFIDSLFVIVVSFLYAYVIFDVKIHLSIVPFLAMFIVVLLLSTGALSLVAASISLAFKNINLFTNVIIGLMQVLCGVYFPITLFPNAVQQISAWLPMTNTIIGIRNILEGETFSQNLIYVGKEFLIGIILFGIAAILIKIMENIAKKTGALLEIE
ncbi:ABC transporter permease [Robertmurraya massiliosenegalensis]|uniref:ABC transporter permease n=1 Tax=Robertmurraya TaxID=2837507 RepID=UPI0039A5B6C0